MAIQVLRDVARGGKSAFSGAPYFGNTAPDPAVFQRWYMLDGTYFEWDDEAWFQPPGPRAQDGAGVVIQTVEVDFGSGASSRIFTVAAPGATVGQKVVAAVSLDMPAGVSGDELEMDPITCAARVSATDVVQIAAGAHSAITGKRNINLILG